MYCCIVFAMIEIIIILSLCCNQFSRQRNLSLAFNDPVARHHKQELNIFVFWPAAILWDFGFAALMCAGLRVCVHVFVCRFCACAFCA